MGIFAVVVVVVAVVWFLVEPATEHFEDTNAADDYSLQVITEENVVKGDLGTRGRIKTSETQLDLAGLTVSDGIKYSSDKFTGTYFLHVGTLFKGSDIHVIISDFTMTEGSFAFYIVFDGKIVGQVEPNQSGVAEFVLENVDKTAGFSYVIAGESAAFSFTAPTDFN